MSRLETQLWKRFDGFLLSPRGNKLCLSEGFLFFGDKTDIAKHYAKVEPSMVYLTISAVLQSARDTETTRDALPKRLRIVVLAPECFLRFNDAILQACMLRACHPAELDYSSSPELSKVMKELLVKVFARWDKDFGDAALEFRRRHRSGFTPACQARYGDAAGRCIGTARWQAVRIARDARTG
ncbi:hypothetical protein ULG90_20975 [Halopseudomonas pachastrellae]|nr:hypothetical protein ULG90_20975 [Halopseudomonas pachastrellae]